MPARASRARMVAHATPDNAYVQLVSPEIVARLGLARMSFASMVASANRGFAPVLQDSPAAAVRSARALA